MITDYAYFWPVVSPRCEVLTCRFDSTHVLHIDNDAICLCDFHIGKFAPVTMSLQIHSGCVVSIDKIERG